jgi:hypothetical protein
LGNPDLGLGHIFTGIDSCRVEFRDGVPDNTSTCRGESGKTGGALYVGRTRSRYRR